MWKNIFLVNVLVPCSNISPAVVAPYYEISRQMMDIGVYMGLGQAGGIQAGGIQAGVVGTICQASNISFYAATFSRGLSRDVIISDRLLWTPNTMFNVLYHEVLHVCGLAHSNNPGVMNYTMRYNNQYGAVIEDPYKIYPSYYDILNLQKKEGVWNELTG